MTELPKLSSSDIRAQLEKHYAHERKHHLFAFYGTGDESTIDVSTAGRFFVVPVQSELDLRDQLTRYESADARAAFLVPWSTEVPMDLRGRFARGGKVLRVGSAARLQRMFEVAEVSDEARRSQLARYLLTTAPDATYRAPGGRLTEAVMWETWLTKRFGLDAPGGLALSNLLGWAAVDGHGDAFAKAMRAPDAAGVRDALLAFLSDRVSVAAPAVWAAWEGGSATAVLAWAVLCEGFDDLTEAAQVWVRQRLRQELEIDEVSEATRAARALGEASGAALAYVERRTSVRHKRQVLAEADALVDEPSVRDALGQHRRLPSAWRARLDALGAVLSEASAKPTAASLERASDALAHLESHELYPAERETNTVKRAAMAVRLLAWLVARPDERTKGQAAPHGDAVALGNWYAAEGGYVDWARSFARGASGDAFGRGVQAVVEAADDARAEIDARFARGLAAWIAAGRPSSDVVPIDHALARIAAPFLKGDDERRLLVVLMDGMAWAQAVELLQSMGERAMAWGPLAWHATTEGRIGSTPVPTVFATLPTTTEVSRAAFFAGKAMKPGAKTSTSKDPERFEAHRQLRALCGENTMPRLLLRAEGSTAGGAITQEALTLVQSEERRVVGIVVNAIDASLKRDPQQHPRWGVDAIKPLGDLLDAAQRAGRAILLASDHGHVPTDLLKRIDSSGSPTRWRAWDDGDQLVDGEIKLSGEGVWTPKGKQAVVLLTGDRLRYGKTPNAGEHGGASLAEVVAPCVLIGSATNAQRDDVAQRVVGAPVPQWWLLRVREPEVVETRPSKKRRPKKPDNQLELPAVAPAPSEEPSPNHEAPPVVDLSKHPLSKSKLFRSLAKTEREQEEVIRAVEFLQSRGGAATQEAFAGAMGDIEWRVPGLVSKLQGVLNVDGYQVLWFDQAGKQVRLDVGKLELQFLGAQ